MQGTLDLFKLKLSPDNTMFFNNITEQTNFFDSKVALSIPNISFNGSRPFRLSANYLDTTFNNYTYDRNNNRLGRSYRRMSYWISDFPVCVNGQIPRNAKRSPKRG